MNKFIQLLTQLPEETQLGFATGVREINILLAQENSPNKIYPMIFKDQELPERVRFAAFYGLLVHLWSNREFAQYRKIVDEYEQNFKGHPLFPTFKAQYYYSIGFEKPHLYTALDYAEQAIKKTPELPNVLHLYAELVAQIGEVITTTTKSQQRSAERAINRAIAIDKEKYAKYFATKARILAIQERFSEARKAIHKAIELEPSDNPLYFLRLSDYHIIRSNINFSEQTAKITKKQLESLQHFNESRLRVVELLGLLAAVIAFLVTGTQVVRNLQFAEATRLMVLIGGIIIVIFSTYSMIFYRQRIRMVQVFTFFIGFILVTMAWIFH